MLSDAQQVMHVDLRSGITYGIRGLLLASAPECPAVEETLVVNIPLVWTARVALLQQKPFYWASG